MGETAARFLPWPLEGSRGTIRKVPGRSFGSFPIAGKGTPRRRGELRVGTMPAKKSRSVRCVPSSVIRLAGDGG